MSDRQQNSVLWQSGLAAHEFVAPGLRVEEVPGRGLHTVRRMAAPEWPVRVGEVLSQKDSSVLCLRPDEWMLVTTGTSTTGWLSQLPTGAVHIDRSQAYAVLRLSGMAAPWLLAKLSALDYPSAASRPAPHCAQTRMGQVRAIVHFHQAVPEDGLLFDVMVERSLARYLWERFLEAAPHASRLAAGDEAWSA